MSIPTAHLALSPSPLPTACVVCGCTEERACLIGLDRPCSWAFPEESGKISLSTEWIPPGWCTPCADRFPTLFALAVRTAAAAGAYEGMSATL